MILHAAEKLAIPVDTVNHAMIRWLSNVKAKNGSTVRGQKYFHNVGISIDFNVFSCLPEKLLCFCWSTHSYAVGVIWKLDKLVRKY